MEENDVLEIGPGPGMLTRAILLQGARRLVAVEKDTRFSALLDVSGCQAKAISMNLAALMLKLPCLAINRVCGRTIAYHV